jgi:hypothetical protein
MAMKSDPIVEEVRRIRDELARKFNYDVRAIGEDAMSRQRNTLTPEELKAIRAKPAKPSAPVAVHEKPTSDYKPR